MRVAVNDQGYRIGEDHPNAKLTNHEVDLILDLRDQCMSYRQIADKMEVSKSLIRDICKGRKRCQSAWRWKEINV